MQDNNSSALHWVTIESGNIQFPPTYLTATFIAVFKNIIDTRAIRENF